mmetsp:Transcript_45140/g.51074  ORF Transcript_45140/g.51074 Transcript_45140/m.51074 type:complete len:551 (+) Transcript_45140:216-1868(+)
MQDNTTQIFNEENNKFLSERLLGGSTTSDDDDNDNGQYNQRRGDTVINESIAANIGENGGGEEGLEGLGGRGFGQQPEYRDAPFAIAFLIHISVVLFVAVAWGIPALRQQQNDDDVYDNNDESYGYVSLSGILWLCFLTCLISISISAVSLQVMMHHAEILIQSSLIGSCCCFFVVAILFFVEGRGLVTVGLCWVILLLVTVWYATSVWNRIPFAAANLRTALSAVQTNGGICVVAYGIAFVAMIWTGVWSLALIGVSFKESTCISGVCQPHMNAISMMLLILSFYWTSQVLQNVLHVTVSGVVGTWWFDPQDALSVFSPAIVDSFRRSTTYSFGSICMGSLLVAIIQSMEAMVRSARQQNNQGVGTILLCIIECILRMISRIAIYFNRWAYCYVGLYGFDYISSGKKAMELFQARGWTIIITDNLVHRSLALVSIVIGALSGIICMLVAKATGWTTTIFGSSNGEGGEGEGDSSSLLSVSDDGIVFFICFLIGMTMSFILLNVVLSAVDTVIVAFAEAPAEFNTNHPALYNNMIQKWRLVFPDECVDFH